MYLREDRKLGNYIEIRDISYHIMAGLIEHFCTYEFDKLQRCITRK